MSFIDKAAGLGSVDVHFQFRRRDDKDRELLIELLNLTSSLHYPALRTFNLL